MSFLDAEIFALTAGGAEASAAARLYRQLSVATRADAAVDEGRRILASYANEPWYAAALGDFTLDADTWAQLGAWTDYDPYPDLRRVSTPTLAVLGEEDPLVPVAASVAGYEHTAVMAARSQQIAVLPGADHRMRTSDGKFAPGYLTLLTDWCAGPRLAGGSPP